MQINIFYQERIESIYVSDKHLEILGNTKGKTSEHLYSNRNINNVPKYTIVQSS